MILGGWEFYFYILYKLQNVIYGVHIQFISYRAVT